MISNIFRRKIPHFHLVRNFHKPIMVNKYNIEPFKNICRLMPADKYLAKKLNEDISSRYRLYRRINMNHGEMKLLEDTSFEQTVSDDRKGERIFKLIPENLLKQSAFKDILYSVMKYTDNYNENYNENNYDIHVHLVRNLVQPKSTATNSPEGTHQDGADFIMSALVLGLYNVDGGVSTVYLDNDQILSVQLQEGQGLIHDDKYYYHNVSAIKSKDNKNSGYRDILGLDVTKIRPPSVARP